MSSSQAHCCSYVNGSPAAVRPDFCVAAKACLACASRCLVRRRTGVIASPPPSEIPDGGDYARLPTVASEWVFCRPRLLCRVCRVCRVCRRLAPSLAAGVCGNRRRWIGVRSKKIMPSNVACLRSIGPSKHPRARGLNPSKDRSACVITCRVACWIHAINAGISRSFITRCMPSTAPAACGPRAI